MQVSLLVADAYPNFSICGIPYHVSGEVPDWRNLADRSTEELEAQDMLTDLVPDLEPPPSMLESGA